MRTVFPLDDGYIHEKLHAALTTAAGSKGTATQRLALAFDSQLSKLEASNLEDLKIPSEVGRELQRILTSLRESFTRPRGERSWDLGGLDETEVDEILSKLIVIYGEVCRLLPSSCLDYESCEDVT